jgi:hypothetical protein
VSTHSVANCRSGARIVLILSALVSLMPLRGIRSSNEFSMHSIEGKTTGRLGFRGLSLIPPGRIIFEAIPRVFGIRRTGRGPHAL